MSKNFVVAYLSSKYVNINSLDNFILNYSKFDPGCEHKLVICFKNLTSEEIAIRKKKLINIKCDYFIDYEKKNDFEWGTLKRLCQKYNKDIFWLHDHSYPRVKGWLRNIVEIYNKKTIVGCSSSFSSHYSNAFYRKKDDTYLQIIIKIIKYFFLFPKFPNPHLRTTGFLINASDFLMFIKDKKIDSKIDSFNPKKIVSIFNSSEANNGSQQPAIHNILVHTSIVFIANLMEFYLIKPLNFHISICLSSLTIGMH